MATKMVELGVDGMHCNACATKVQRAVEKVPGVVSAKVDLAAKRVHVEWAAGEPDLRALKAAVIGVGFKVIE